MSHASLTFDRCTVDRLDKSASPREQPVAAADEASAVVARQRDRARALIDALARAAITEIGCSAGVVGLFDGRRHWLSAQAGWNAPRAARMASWFGRLHAAYPDPITLDADQDLRFRRALRIAGEPALQTYLGARLSVDGAFAGFVGVLDQAPAGRFGAHALDPTRRALEAVLRRQRKAFDAPLTLAATPAPPTVAGGKRLEPRFSGLRVLVAEDVAVNRDLICIILARHGVVVTAVENGVEAMAAAASERFDLVFMDVRMPVMNGLEATRQIRNSGGDSADTMIVALTASVMPAEIAMCRSVGMDNHVEKPFTAARIAAALEDAVAHRRTSHELERFKGSLTPRRDAGKT